jgi:MoaA/NifB/PqqE/SkfB family radical SAM enzyme
MEMIQKKAEEINHHNLQKAIQLAEKGDVTNVIITGKGEPTLYPEHIDTYMYALDGKFPFVELQTNGSILVEDSYKGKSTTEYLSEWHKRGMTTVMISNCGYDPELNRQIYFPNREEYIDLKKLIDKIHDVGMIVRYTTIGIKGGIEDISEFDKLVDFCKEMGIEQLTWRPVAKTSVTEDESINEWVENNGLDIYPDRDAKFLNGDIPLYMEDWGVRLYDLVHGASVYDYKGQNVCVSTCLTRDADDTLVRQLIFFPNGELYTDWEYKGSRLL